MTDTRSSSALFKRAEQLKRWEESDTNKQSPLPRQATRIQFSSGIVFLAACTAGDKEEVQRLLKMGADINTANVDGLTALHQACIDDNLDMVEFLLASGADVNRGDNEGWTPLHATASCGFLSIARYLVESGADVAAVNYDGELPVDIAESDEMENLLQKAIDEKGVDCEKSRNAEVNTLMSDAKNWAANGYVEVRDQKTGGTPLHVAAAKGYIDVARMLLEECGADPDSVDYEGWTPLHAAALWGQREAAALLLKFGADPDIKNYSGQTCVDLVDPSISSWLAEAALKAPKRIKNNNNNNNNNINKRKRSPPRHDVKRVELQITGQNDNANEKPPVAPEIISKSPEGKPPKARAPSPEASEPKETAGGDEPPSWRRSASFRGRQPDVTRENKPPIANNVTDNDTILRRTHSFENDKTMYKYKERGSFVSLLISRFDDISRARRVFEKLNEIAESFVPPIRDEESETQRKAHAKRVRETRRSTQGVTLDEIKSAEQLVKKKTSNGAAAEPPAPAAAPAPVAAPALADPASFELEDAGQTASRASADTTVTLPLRRAPASPTSATSPPPERGEEEKESSSESKSGGGSGGGSPASTQAALNVIQRRRRPKRRSTGVGHLDMDDIVNDRGGGVESEADADSLQSGSERTEDEAGAGAGAGAEAERDYKALYEASSSEVRRLRALLATSEQHLRDARATITRLTQVNQNSLSEIEKREKRAMERKLSEMEEELKFQQTLQAENQRLKDENGALIRVISKLSK